MKKIMIPLFLFTTTITKISFASERTQQLNTFTKILKLPSHNLSIQSTSKSISREQLEILSGSLAMGSFIGPIINDNSRLISSCATSRKGPSFQQLILKLTMPKEKDAQDAPSNISNHEITINYKRYVSDDKEDILKNKSIFDGLITRETNNDHLMEKELHATLGLSIQMLLIQNPEKEQNIHPRDIKKISDIMHALKNGSFQWNHTQKFTKIETEDDL